MPIIAIVVLLANAGFQQSLPSNPPAKQAVSQNNSGEQTNDSRKADHNETPNTVCNGCSIEAQPKSETEKQKSPNSEKDALYRWYLIATIVGVVGAWIGLGFIWNQMKLLKVSADAAKKSADALISIERPWIFPTSAHHQVEYFPEGRVATSVWRFKNFGKTPAFIYQVDSTLELVANPEVDLPPDPIYGKPYKIYEETSALAPDQESQPIGTKMSRVITREEEVEIWNDKLFLVFYCRIRYSTAFKESVTGESKFCYQYVSARGGHPVFGFVRLCGPKAYNEYT
jgi:hypothetical protein